MKTQLPRAQEPPPDGFLPASHSRTIPKRDRRILLMLVLLAATLGRVEEARAQSTAIACQGRLEGVGIWVFGASATSAGGCASRDDEVC